MSRLAQGCTAVAALFLTGSMPMMPMGCPAASVELTTQATGQQQSNWCWAASGALAMNTVHPASQVMQCDEVNRQYGAASSTGRTVDCCQHPGSCNFAGYPKYTDYSFTATKQPPLSWDQLRMQLSCKGKPVAFIWRRPGYGSHMMVIVGYKMTDDNVAQLLVSDPLPVDKGALYWIPYDSYNPGPYADHQLDENDFDITHTGS